MDGLLLNSYASYVNHYYDLLSKGYQMDEMVDIVAFGDIYRDAKLSKKYEKAKNLPLSLAKNDIQITRKQAKDIQELWLEEFSEELSIKEIIGQDFTSKVPFAKTSRQARYLFFKFQGLEDEIRYILYGD